MSGLFSIDSNGNRVVNSLDTLDRNPTSCIKSHIKSVLSNNLKYRVTTILSEYDAYVTKNGVEIATFGQSNCSKETSRSRSHTNSIPTAINDIIAVLDPDNNQNLNTVLVKRFSSKGSTAESCFVDKTIRPESEIHALTIGGPFGVTFKDKVTNQVTHIDIEDNSCCVMSQQSQFYWSHNINCDNLSSEYQYTISFLSTGRNHNSTLIIGDSNTYNIKFQSERKWSTLGKYITGKRYTCYVVENIELDKCWSELDFNSFVNDPALLDDNFGHHYDAETGKRDRIHLGRLGIARLGLMYKDAILGKSGVNGRLYADVTRRPGDDHIS